MIFPCNLNIQRKEMFNLPTTKGVKRIIYEDNGKDGTYFRGVSTDYNFLGNLHAVFSELI